MVHVNILTARFLEYLRTSMYNSLMLDPLEHKVITGPWRVNAGETKKMDNNLQFASCLTPDSNEWIGNQIELSVVQVMIW
jgi:hypothetical protein